MGVPLGIALVGALIYIIHLKHAHSRIKANELGRRAGQEKDHSARQQSHAPASGAAASADGRYQSAWYGESELAAERELAELTGQGRAQLAGTRID